MQIGLEVVKGKGKFQQKQLQCVFFGAVSAAGADSGALQGRGRRKGR